MAKLHLYAFFCNYSQKNKIWGHLIWPGTCLSLRVGFWVDKELLTQVNSENNRIWHEWLNQTTATFFWAPCFWGLYQTGREAGNSYFEHTAFLHLCLLSHLWITDYYLSGTRICHEHAKTPAKKKYYLGLLKSRSANLFLFSTKWSKTMERW